MSDLVAKREQYIRRQIALDNGTRGGQHQVRIRKIELLAEDQKGFWEIRGYSNSAEPWFNDRYSTG